MGLLQGKQETYNHKLKNLINKPAEEWVRTENAHEPIILHRDFELVQKILSLDTCTAPDGKEVYLFSGLLICGSCGGPMTRKTNTVNGKKYVYYYCPTGKKHGCPRPVMLREDVLTACVLNSLQAHIKNVIELDSLLDSMGEEQVNRELVDGYRAQIHENEMQLDRLRHFKTALYESFISGLLTKRDYRDMKADYSQQMEKLQSAIDNLRENIEKAQHNADARQRWMQHFKRFSTMTQLDRRATVALIQSIRVLGKKDLDITFRYQAEYDEQVDRLSPRKETV